MPFDFTSRGERGDFVPLTFRMEEQRYNLNNLIEEGERRWQSELNVDVLYTLYEKSRVLGECTCRMEFAYDTGHFESMDCVLRTKPELRAALRGYIPQILALLTTQVYSNAGLDVHDIWECRK